MKRPVQLQQRLRNLLSLICNIVKTLGLFALVVFCIAAAIAILVFGFVIVFIILGIVAVCVMVAICWFIVTESEQNTPQREKIRVLHRFFSLTSIFIQGVGNCEHEVEARTAQLVLRTFQTSRLLLDLRPFIGCLSRHTRSMEYSSM